MHVFMLNYAVVCFRFILKISNLQLTNQNAGFVTAMRCCVSVTVCICTHV